MTIKRTPKLSEIDNALADAGMTPEQITPILQAVKHRPALLAALTAAQALLYRIDHITTDEFSKGGDRPQREALRASLDAVLAA